MKRKGILIVLSGFSGAGKGTIVKTVLERYDSYVLSISATTRNPREGETDGVSYFFKTEEEFLDMIQKDAFVEYARYVENYYGTPRAFVEQNLEAGNDVILEIEIQGAMKIKEKYPDALLLFVTAPSADVLRDRLTGRGTETEDVIRSRLARANEEAEGIENYDYLIVNDDLDTAVREFHEITEAQHRRIDRNLKLIETIREELKKFQKGE